MKNCFHEYRRVLAFIVVNKTSYPSLQQLLFIVTLSSGATLW